MIHKIENIPTKKCGTSCAHKVGGSRINFKVTVISESVA